MKKEKEGRREGEGGGEGRMVKVRRTWRGAVVEERGPCQGSNIVEGIGVLLVRMRGKEGRDDFDVAMMVLEMLSYNFEVN